MLRCIAEQYLCLVHHVGLQERQTSLVILQADFNRGVIFHSGQSGPNILISQQPRKDDTARMQTSKWVAQHKIPNSNTKNVVTENVTTKRM